MKEINIARVLATRRREKGITQEELAGYIGVSKASVSKWETGQSYPDITFLPQLAAYFNLSIDDLMGYEPQMTREDSKKLYHKLADDFASRPFDEVFADVRRTARKYLSCFPLLYQLGILLINHQMLAGDPAASAEAVTLARELFIRTKTESGDVELAKQALHMEALCLLLQNRPQEVLVLLEGADVHFSSVETLFASAYQMLGRTEEAAASLQVGIFQQIVSAVDLLCQYMEVFSDDFPRFERISQRAAALIDAFALQTLHPASVLKFRFTAAYGFAVCGKIDDALENLQVYADVAAEGLSPLRLHTDDFFDKMDGWLDEIDPLPPRSETTVKKGLISAIDHPAFEILREDPRFARMMDKLIHTLKEV